MCVCEPRSATLIASANAAGDDRAIVAIVTIAQIAFGSICILTAYVLQGEMLLLAHFQRACVKVSDRVRVSSYARGGVGVGDGVRPSALRSSDRQIGSIEGCRSGVTLARSAKATAQIEAQSAGFILPAFFMSQFAAFIPAMLMSMARSIVIGVVDPCVASAARSPTRTRREVKMRDITSDPRG